MGGSLHRNYRSGNFPLTPAQSGALIYRSGNNMIRTVWAPVGVGRLIRDPRRAPAPTHPPLPLSADVGVRFPVDMKKGKPTAQIGKIMQAPAALGIEMPLSLPASVKL